MLVVVLDSAEALPQRHFSFAHTSTRTKVGVAVAVPVAVTLPPPLRVGVGGLEGEVLRPPDLDPLLDLVRVVEEVEERDSVRVPRGDLVVEGLALAVHPPLPVAVGVEEAEGEVDTEGVPGVGTWEALGDTVGVGWGGVGVRVGEPAKDPDRVGVMVWVTEEAR